MTVEHPGFILAIELKTRRIKQRAFARSIGMSESQFNEICNGKRHFPIELAYQLEKNNIYSMEYWLTKQMRYEIYSYRQTHGDVNSK